MAAGTCQDGAVPRSTTETDWPRNSRTVVPLLSAVRDTGERVWEVAVRAVPSAGWLADACRPVPQAATALAAQTTAIMKTRTRTEVRRTGPPGGFRSEVRTLLRVTVGPAAQNYWTIVELGEAIPDGMEHVLAGAAG